MSGIATVKRDHAAASTVAVGLMVYGLFSLTQARCRRITTT